MSEVTFVNSSNRCLVTTGKTVAISYCCVLPGKQANSAELCCLVLEKRHRGNGLCEGFRGTGWQDHPAVGTSPMPEEDPGAGELGPRLQSGPGVGVSSRGIRSCVTPGI